VLSQEKDKIGKVILLNNALQNEKLSDEEICWALWNISDNLACLRKSKLEYKNHKVFEQKILSMDKKYLHWLVSDGTQKLTLYIGGYEEFWNELYQHACQNSFKTADNIRIRFESHRAAVASPVNRKVEYNNNFSHLALDNLKNVLEEAKEDYNYPFYLITYLTQYINSMTISKEKCSSRIIEDAYESFINLLPLLNENKDELDDNDAYFIGSWQQLNGKRSKYRQAKVGIGNYIIALIDAGEYEQAIDCYEQFRTFKVITNEYFNDKILLAKEKRKRF